MALVLLLTEPGSQEMQPVLKKLGSNVPRSHSAHSA
jgi:hypothetical protein